MLTLTTAAGLRGLRDDAAASRAAAEQASDTAREALTRAAADVPAAAEAMTVMLRDLAAARESDRAARAELARIRDSRAADSARELAGAVLAARDYAWELAEDITRSVYQGDPERFAEVAENAAGIEAFFARGFGDRADLARRVTAVRRVHAMDGYDQPRKLRIILSAAQIIYLFLSGEPHEAKRDYGVSWDDEPAQWAWP